MTAPATFKKADLNRALKAVRDCGLEVSETHVRPDGTIVIVHNQPKLEKNAPSGTMNGRTFWTDETQE